MPVWVNAAVLVLALAGQLNGQNVGPAAEEMIRDAIGQLGASRFSARRQASRFLWQQGRAAETQLKRAVESPDREVRLRAQRILNDFQYGILPGVPADVIALLREYRDGNTALQKLTFQRLVRRGRFEEVQRLIRMESNPELRKSLLQTMLTEENAVDRFVELERLEALIEVVGEDQEASWRRTALAQCLFSRLMIQRLLENRRLDVLVMVVQREPSAAIRREMLSILFGNTSTIAALIEKEQLSFVLKLIAEEPDATVRSGWINQLLAGTETVKMLAEDDSLERVLDFARKHMEDEQRSALLERLFKNYTIVGALLEKRGLERLVKMAASEKDAATRGRTLAVLVGSHAIQQNLSPQVQIEWMLRVAREEKDETARGEYLKVLMTGGTIYVLLQDPDSRRLLWGMVKSAKSDPDDDSTWRGDTVYRILTYSSPEDVLKEPEQTEWLIGFLRDDVTDQQRVQILERMLADHRTQKILAEHNRLDPLLALILKQPDQERGRLLGRFAASRDLIQKMISEKQTKRLIDLAINEKNTDTRLQYLSGLFRNSTAMTELIKGDGYDRLWELVIGTKDPVEHAKLRGEFYSSSAVIQVVAEKEQLESLVEFARQTDDPEARRQYLQRLCSNSNTVSQLIDKDQYDALFTLIDEETDESSRRTMLAAFYVNSKVVEQLVKREQVGQLLEFARDELGGNQLSSYLQRIIYNQEMIGAIVQQEQLDVLITLIRDNPNKYLRSSMMRTVFTAPKVVEHFIHHGELDKLFERIAEEPEQVRSQVYPGLFSRSETIKALVEKKQVEKALELIGQVESASSRGSLLGRLVVQIPLVEYLVGNQRVDRLIQLAHDESDMTARRQYLQSLLASTTAVKALLDKGHFDALRELASEDPDAKQQASLQARLLSNSQTVQYLIAEKKVDLLLNAISGATDSAIRQLVLSSIAQSETAITALIEADQFAQLLQLCRTYSNAATELKLLSSLMVSSRAVLEIAEMGELDKMVKAVLGQANASARRKTVHSWLARRETLNVLLEHGQFDALYRVAKSEPNATERDRLLGYLLTNSKAIEMLAADDRIPWLLKHFSEGMNASMVAQNLRNLMQQPESVGALAAAGYFDELMELVKDKISESGRSSLLITLFYNTSTIQKLADNDQLTPLVEQLISQGDVNLRRQFLQTMVYNSSMQKTLGNGKLARQLLAILKSDREDTNTQSIIRHMLSNQSIRQILVDSGQSDVLLELAKLEPDEAKRKSNLQSILYGPTGLIPYHLRRGEWDDVERLLGGSADNDLGRLRLATYLLITDRLEPQIVKLRQRVQQQADPADLRMLTYLLRAQGDLSAARSIAEQTGDPGLLCAVLVEGGWWSEAADLQAAESCPLAIPPREKQATDAAHLQAQQLGLVAAYQRLAGRHEDAGETLDEIQKLPASNPDDEKLAWFAVEALLLNDRVEDGLQLLAATIPERAFQLYLYRYDYPRAFALVGIEDDTTIDEVWLQGLPASSSDASQQTLQRCSFAATIAKTLYRSGRRSQGLEMIDLLEQQAERLPTSESTSAPQKQVQRLIAAALVKMGQFERACEMGVKSLTSSNNADSILSTLFPERRYEALAWWRLVRRQHSTEPATDTLRRVAEAMNPTEEDGGDPLERLFDAVDLAVGEMPDAERNYLLYILTETCLLCDRIDDARRFVDQIDDSKAYMATRVNVMRQSGQWQAAAEIYYAMWEERHERLGSLYLSGDALIRAGQTEEGKQRIETASRSALDSRARVDMALDLLRNGLREEAFAQFRIVLRTAPFGYWEWHESARQLGEAPASDDPADVVRWQELALLDDLRTWYYLTNKSDYLRARSNLSHWRARAALAAGDEERAEVEIDRAIAASPGQTDLAEELVPLLEQENRGELADRLFTRLAANYQTRLKQYPDSALMHNNLAWLSARCGRSLDEALQHAEKAVALEPDSAAYADTLAEAHFRLGDREAAIRASRRAVRLRPGDATLRQQLQRFEKDPLP